jgi:Collagen triple helix repeat (20 copies)
MRTFFVAAGLVAVVIGAAAFALLAATAPASCNDANAARTAGLYVQSANGYISVLAKHPRSTCAASGMQKLCDQANTLIKKEPREANAIFTAMFSHEPEASHPQHKLYVPCAELGENKTAITSTTTSQTNTTPPKMPNGHSKTTVHAAGTGTTNVTVTVNATVAAGRRGPKGDPGIPGRTGRNGATGQNGRNGRNGATGQNGRNGRNGATGQNGRNGRNGTTEVIVCPTTKNCGAG